MTVDHNARHHIDHYSNSCLRLFREEPMVWIGKYMLRTKDDAGPGAWRGLAVEAGLDRWLFTQDAEATAQTMETEWNNQAQGVADDDAMKEYGSLVAFLAQATLAFAERPVPLHRQARIELTIPGITVPLIGFADWVWSGTNGSHGFGSDLKTTWRIPSEPDPNHVEQVASYSRAFNGIPFDLTYVSPKRWVRYDIPEPAANEAWERVVETAHALQTFLGKVEDAHDALSIFSSNYKSFYFSPAMTEAIRAAKAKRLL